MKIIPFSEIKNELISNMQRGLLIPIIGSGFTRNCSSFRGKVPSGNDYRRYMIGRILEAEPSLSVEKERLEKETFSNISSMYHKVVPNEAQERLQIRDWYIRKRMDGCKICSDSFQKLNNTCLIGTPC